jgi:hypothetical protein
LVKREELISPRFRPDLDGSGILVAFGVCIYGHRK